MLPNFTYWAAVPVRKRCEAKRHWNQVPKDLVTDTRSVEIHLRREAEDQEKVVWLHHLFFNL